MLRPEASVKSDRLTTTDIAQALGVDKGTVLTWLKQHPQETKMEKPNSGARNNVPTYARSVLETAMRDTELMRIASANVSPEEVKSLPEVATELPISLQSLIKLVKKHHMPLGEYRFGSRKRVGLGMLPHDQKYVRDLLEEKGHFSGSPEAGEKSIFKFAQDIGVPYATVRHHAFKLTEENPSFGRLVWRKVGSKPTMHLTAKQAAILEQDFEGR